MITLQITKYDGSAILLNKDCATLQQAYSTLNQFFTDYYYSNKFPDSHYPQWVVNGIEYGANRITSSFIFVIMDDNQIVTKGWSNLNFGLIQERIED